MVASRRFPRKIWSCARGVTTLPLLASSRCGLPHRGHGVTISGHHQLCGAKSALGIPETPPSGRRGSGVNTKQPAHFSNHQ